MIDPVLVLLPPLLPPFPELSSELDIEFATPLDNPPLPDFVVVLLSCPPGGAEDSPLEPDPPDVVVPPLPEPFEFTEPLEDPDPLELPELLDPLDDVPGDPEVPALFDSGVPAGEPLPPLGVLPLDPDVPGGVLLEDVLLEGGLLEGGLLEGRLADPLLFTTDPDPCPDPLGFSLPFPLLLPSVFPLLLAELPFPEEDPFDPVDCDPFPLLEFI